MMNKRLEQRASLAETPVDDGVNGVIWARQFMVEQGCQNRVDTKAFKGRGKFLELRQLLAQLDEVETQMKDLSERTKALPGHWIYLMVHCYRSGLYFVRWRERGGAKRHLAWEQAALTWQGQTAEVQQWCESVSKYGVALNERHKDLMRAIRATRAVIQRSSPPVFAKPIPTTPR